MKTIAITFKRLKEILKAVEQNKKYPIHLRTYKINPFKDLYLKVLFKKNGTQ